MNLYDIKILTQDEFNANPEFYQKSFDDISLSQNLYPTINLREFFHHHPINSIVYIIESKKIVAFIYATPYRDYLCSTDTDIKYWGINYIQVHKNFERKGYAYKLALVEFEDMKRKGANKVDFLPNEKSLKVLSRTILENKIGELTNSARIGVKTLYLYKEKIDK